MCRAESSPYRRAGALASRRQRLAFQPWHIRKQGWQGLRAPGDVRRATDRPPGATLPTAVSCAIFHLSTEAVRSTRGRRSTPAGLLLLSALPLLAACGESKRWECLLPIGVSAEDAPDAVAQIGCEQDFLALASEPLSPSIPDRKSVV